MALLMFDMDGTLVNSGNMIANTINYVRENIGLETMSKEHILKNVNDPKINSAEFFYGTKHFTQEQTVLFEKYYHDNCLTDLEVYDGITELLEELKGEFTMTVATNAGSDFAKKMLNHLDIGHHFDTILGYNDVDNPKPHPEMVQKILNLHDTCHTKAQLIGDSKKDTMAAQRANVDSILVNWGFSDHEEEAIEHVHELKGLIYKKFRVF